MLFISHRGNTIGRDPLTENNPDKISSVLPLYHCYIDLWKYNDELFLGYEKGTHKINIEFLTKNADRLWINCQNSDSLELLHKMQAEYPTNHFYNYSDLYTITSKGYLIGCPGCKLIPGIITLLPEMSTYNLLDLRKANAICSNYIRDFETSLHHITRNVNTENIYNEPIED